MNNTQIEIFSVMVQTENIHHTAQRLGIDAAAVTTSICALENEIGFNLILRGKNISNCLEGKNYGATWWYDSSHSSFFLSIAFRMVSSLRIQATSATFLAFPAASRRT